VAAATALVGSNRRICRGVRSLGPGSPSSPCRVGRSWPRIGGSQKSQPDGLDIGRDDLDADGLGQFGRVQHSFRSQSILQPYDLDNLTILLCVVDIDKKGKATVAWSAAYGTTALSAGQDPPKDIPKDLQEEDVQMIVTRVQYRLNTILSGLFESFTGDGAYEYEQYFLTRPRNGDTITYG
jgi:hypothetical protein